LLKKNGYILEQLSSPLIVHTAPEHAELKEICSARQFEKSCRLSRHVRHERGESRRDGHLGTSSPPVVDPVVEYQ